MGNTPQREVVVHEIVLWAHIPLLKGNLNVRLVKLDTSVIMSAFPELIRIVNGNAQRATTVHRTRPT